METFHFPCFDAHRSTVYYALFCDVERPLVLKNRIIAAATAEGEDGQHEREALNFAFIDARLITSRLHLQTGIYQALLTEAQGPLRTKTVHSEILWTLNPTNNITEAIRRYGVSDTSHALVVVRIGELDKSAQELEAMMKAAVGGSIVPFTSLEDLTDWSTIKKYYKLNNEAAIRNLSGDLVRERYLVDNIVVSSVAMKSVMS